MMGGGTLPHHQMMPFPSDQSPGSDMSSVRLSGRTADIIWSKTIETTDLQETSTTSFYRQLHFTRKPRNKNKRGCASCVCHDTSCNVKSAMHRAGKRERVGRRCQQLSSLAFLGRCGCAGKCSFLCTWRWLLGCTCMERRSH